MPQSPSRDRKFGGVYTTYHAAIRDYCFRRLPPADANDATAEVFLVAWRRIDAMPAGEAALPYLYAIARNVVANTARSERRRMRLLSKVAGLGTPHTEGPEPQIVQQEEARRILAVLEQLKPADRDILRLKAWEQLSNAEIAEVMGLTVRAVDTRLSRARQTLGRKAESARSSSKSAVPQPVEEGGER